MLFLTAMACFGAEMARSGERFVLAQDVFSAEEGCVWQLPQSAGLEMNEAFIWAPKSGADRGAWLDAARKYRAAVRAGDAPKVIAVRFDGVRAWVRLAHSVALALALEEGDALRMRVEARWIEGNGELCFALDLDEAANGGWANWSGVRATAAIPRDGAWHWVRGNVTVPTKARADAYWRPIIGMDATRDATPGRVEIRAIDLAVDDPARTEAAVREAQRLYRPDLDLGNYDRADLAWAASAFTCHFAFLYDTSFYDADGGCHVDAVLDDGDREFGGYDAILLWQAYPRIGVDERNQFDFYRDLPGGLEGVRDVVQRCHARGVKTFIDYNPWDRGTRREGKPDEEALADLVAAIEADGIFLDTMTAGSQALRAVCDAARPGVVFAPEGHPDVSQLAICNASWMQGLPDADPPGMPRLKWIEPRHMQHQMVDRWLPKRDNLETAFFNGGGVLVWENIFGTYNPWDAHDRALWRRAVGILRAFAPEFASDAWEPFVQTARDGLYTHRWPGRDVVVFTLRNMGATVEDAPLFETPLPDKAMTFFDAWRGKPARWERVEDMARVYGDIERVACIVQCREDDTRMQALLRRQRDLPEPKLEEDVRDGAKSAIDPKPVAHTEPAKAATPPGMVFVPGGTARMRLTHLKRECGCYPDPGTPPERRHEFYGHYHGPELTHDYAVEVDPFFIDETEVSNAEYRAFLEVTAYRPKHPENFLKHWPDSEMPAELADRPVVYVDLEDARAYAAWAGKRLPTEPEWQLAAQGTDGRAWPWGETFDPARCNTTGDRTLPVRSLPEGRSPYGCYHMSGNVWEWTESERDDGHTRFAILRGGSYFEAKGSIWYVPGGPQPCTSHAKFLLMWPGLDRCATIGFRCVRDAGAHRGQE